MMKHGKAFPTLTSKTELRQTKLRNPVAGAVIQLQNVFKPSTIHRAEAAGQNSIIHS
jgi:hypothetical protein